MKKEKKEEQKKTSHVLRHRHPRAGNRGGRDVYADTDPQFRGLSKGIARIPNGRKLDRMADDGRHWDTHTGLFLRHKGYEPKKAKSSPFEIGLLKSELNGDPE